MGPQKVKILLIKNLTLNVLNYFYNSSLLAFLSFSIIMFILAITGTSFEKPILKLLLSHFQSSNVYITQTQFIIDGKDYMSYFSLVVVIVPIIFGFIVKIVKKVIHITISKKLLLIALLLYWVVGSIVLSVKFDSVFIALLLLFAASIAYITNVALGALISFINKNTKI